MSEIQNCWFYTYGHLIHVSSLNMLCYSEHNRHPNYISWRTVLHRLLFTILLEENLAGVNINQISQLKFVWHSLRGSLRYWTLTVLHWFGDFSKINHDSSTCAATIPTLRRWRQEVNRSRPSSSIQEVEGQSGIYDFYLKKKSYLNYRLLLI